MTKKDPAPEGGATKGFNSLEKIGMIAE